nr:Aminodeoxychorismate lyase [Klebsiella pneumoniae]
MPLGRNSWLAGLKHLNRLEQVLIRSHLEQTDADEALVLTVTGGLRNAVPRIYSGVRDVMYLLRDSIMPGSTALCGSAVSRSWHHRRFALSK